MKYVLFLGGRVGYEALLLLSDQVSVEYAYIEVEHAHEKTEYSHLMVQLCARRGISHSTDLQSEEVRANLSGRRFDYLMCFGYRRMIGAQVSQIARIACIGSHFSPLPRYRGFAPLNWLLINGESQTSVNIFFLVDEVDAGDVISTREVQIDENDDINSLLDKCMQVFPQVLEDALRQLESGTPQGTPQNHALATYTCSRNPDDGEVNWSRPSKEIRNMVRALTYPWPGAFTYYQGEKMYIWACEFVEDKTYEGRVCGKVVAIQENGIRVLTGDGSLLLTKCSFSPDVHECSEQRIRSIRATLGR